MGTNMDSDSTKLPFVGFSSLFDHVTSRFLRENYYLNILVVGAKNCGKMSLLNALFKTKFPASFTKTQANSILESPHYLLDDNGIKLNVKITKYCQTNGSKFPGEDLVDYLVQCFENQYEVEYNPKMSKFDHLIHVCLYFLEPYSQEKTLKSLDLNILRCIHDKVNVIPVIAKADCFTSEELVHYKTNLLNEFSVAELDLFKFAPNSFLDLDTSLKLAKLISRFPFAVVGSDTVMRQEKSSVPVRQYPWGTVEIDNLKHSDTAVLRKLMLNTHLNTLIESSHSIYYSEYRIQKLYSVFTKINDLSVNHPLYYMENRYKFTVDYFYKSHESNYEKCMMQIQKLENNAKENEIKLIEENRQRQLEIQEMEREYEERKQYMKQLEDDFIFKTLNLTKQVEMDDFVIIGDVSDQTEGNTKISSSTHDKKNKISVKNKLFALIKQRSNK